MRSSLKARLSQIEAALAPRLELVPVPVLPEPHPAQRQIIQNAARFNVACLGRRAGKSTLGVRLLIETAMEGKPAAWFSPTYKMLVEIWRQMRITLAASATRISDAEHRIELATGGTIEMWSLENADAIRGRKYARAIIDEAAMVPELENAWTMVLRPTLADLVGDAFFFSTPKGRNFFWRLWQRAQAGEKDWRAWRMPSSCNPYLAIEEIEAMRNEMPERAFAQEIDAQFLDDDGVVFRNVNACVATEKPEPSGCYVVGVDFGRTNDFTVAVVQDAKTKAVVEIDRYTDVSFVVQEQRLLALAERWKPQVIVAEINNFGFPMVERLAAMGLPIRPFLTTNASKQAIIDKLSISFEHRAILIPNDDALIAELMAFAVERLPSGLHRYGAPSGTHDDMVMALAFANYAAANF